MKYEDYVLMNNHEVAINGVKIAAKILNIPVPHYSFFDPSEISNKEITGMYVFESDEILFNDEWVTNSPWIEVIITAFHEWRSHQRRTFTSSALDNPHYQYFNVSFIKSQSSSNNISFGLVAFISLAYFLYSSKKLSRS